MTAALLISCLLVGQTAPGVRFVKVAAGTEVVAPLSAADQAKLPVGKLTQDQGETWLRVCVVDAKTGKTGPAMFGAYERRGTELVFRPRFALEPGQLYRAQFGSHAADHRMPSATDGTPPRVVKVLPSGDVQPANLLRFYIYFSQPMRGGQAMFKHFVILDEDGKEVYDPWLHDEIWDEEANCLILYIHPGRIKWGLLLRELLGPVLMPNRRYTFAIRGNTVDAEGRPMGKDFTKAFRTTAEDRARINLEDWKIAAPLAGSREPPTVRFPKCIDHRSLVRFITVTDGTDRRVAGTVKVAADEKSCQFVPERAWEQREYRVNVDPRLEDVAGNTPERPFDMDAKAPSLPAPRLHLMFRPLASAQPGDKGLRQ